MPEILKSSSSCTTFSLLGSLGSLFLTCNAETQRAGRRPTSPVSEKGRLNSTTTLRRSHESTYRFEQLDLIQGRFRVMFRALHNLHGHKALLPAPPPPRPQEAVTKLIPNHMSEAHKHGCVRTHNAKTHWRSVQTLSLELLMKFCKSERKSTI